MPDLITRSDWEAELARRFSANMRANLKKLLVHLGDPPNMDDVPASFWTEMESGLQNELHPVMMDIYIESAEQMLGATPLGVDWGIVNEGAAVFADEYAFSLVTQITDTQRKATQDWVARFYRDGLTLDDLKAGLAKPYGPVRAELIASTEVTRAAVQGEIGFLQELVASGIPVKRDWATSEDEDVCVICVPLGEHDPVGFTEYFIHPISGTPYDQPPAHPRCRCWLNYDILEDENA